MKFKEFLIEASSDVKAAAISAMEAGKYSYKDTSDESRFQFARDMKELGFRGNDVTTEDFGNRLKQLTHYALKLFENLCTKLFTTPVNSVTIATSKQNRVTENKMSKFNFIQIERGYNQYGTPDRYRAVWIKGEHENAVFNVAETRENLVISTYNEFADDPAVNRLVDIAVLDKMEELINAYK